MSLRRRVRGPAPPPLMRMWLFNFMFASPEDPAMRITARVIAETPAAARYILATDPRVDGSPAAELVDAAQCQYAGDLKDHDAGVVELRHV